jgi:hypothetical protein
MHQELIETLSWAKASSSVKHPSQRDLQPIVNPIKILCYESKGTQKIASMKCENVKRGERKQTIDMRFISWYR